MVFVRSDANEREPSVLDWMLFEVQPEGVSLLSSRVPDVVEFKHTVDNQAAGTLYLHWMPRMVRSWYGQPTLRPHPTDWNGRWKFTVRQNLAIWFDYECDESR